MSNYSELLKDPKWQRKRLEILQRDEFTCQYCQSSEKTLHVHHHYYIKERDPWEYHESALITLCEECHSAEERAKGQDAEFIEFMLMNKILRIDVHNMISHIAYRIGEYVPLSAPPKEFKKALEKVRAAIDETLKINNG